MVTHTIFKIVGFWVIWWFLLSTCHHFLGFPQLMCTTSKIRPKYALCSYFHGKCFCFIFNKDGFYTEIYGQGKTKAI